VKYATPLDRPDRNPGWNILVQELRERGIYSAKPLAFLLTETIEFNLPIRR
jgi:hypothetical protein